MGPSSIPISIPKILKSELESPLQVILNTSFSDKFKLARIIPVFKKGSQTNLSNYNRPFSLLSVFNKLLEKLMFNRLADFLEKRHLIYNKQFGFRSHHSTDHAVLSIIVQVQKAIEDRNYSCWIFPAKHLILLIITFYFQSLNSMVSLKTSLPHVWETTQYKRCHLAL